MISIPETSTVSITNVFTTINITLFAVGGAAGVFMTLATKFGSKFIDEYFDNRNAKLQEEQLTEINALKQSVLYKAFQGEL